MMGMPNCKPVGTPFDPNSKLTAFDGEATKTEREKYQRSVGLLMYLMKGTRPDLVFAVGVLSRYANNPAPQHFVAVKSVC